MAATVATTTIVPMVQGAGEAAKQSEELAKQTALDVVARAEEVRARNYPAYDYEKVFWNSTYSLGLFGLGWMAIKGGLFAAGFVNWLNSWNVPFIGPGEKIDDVAIEQMNKVAVVVQHIDNYLTMALPAVPIAIVGAHAGIEYLRKRKFLDKKSKLAGDVTVALAGTMTGVALWQSLTPTPPAPLPKEEVEDIIKKGDGKFVESYRGFDIYYDAKTKKYYFSDPANQLYGIAVSLKDMEGVIDMILKHLAEGGA